MTSLLLIGAAGLDWAGFSARRGALPRLSTLAARGLATWLDAPLPRQGPAAWASLATGFPPQAHQVVQREEPWAAGLRPLSLASWRRPAVWTRLTAAGRHTASIAWPGARHGADQPGEHVDEDFINAAGPTRELWPLPPRCASPQVRDALRDRRVHPSDITADMLAPLVPDLPAIDQSRDTGLPRLAIAMAAAATTQAAAARALEEGRADAVFVHFRWLEEVRDAFEATDEGPFAGAVDGAYRFLDALIGGLLSLAGPDALVMVVSPGRRSNPGALIASGPATAPTSASGGAQALDLAPTALAHFGVTAPDLPGRPIPGLVAAVSLRELAPPPAPDPAPPDAGLLASAVAAGYTPPAPPPPAWRAQGLAELAAAIVEHEPQTAIDLADEALALAPDAALALGIKVLALTTLADTDALEPLAERLMAVAPERGWGALAHAMRHILRGLPDAAVPWLRRAAVDKAPELQLRIANAWLAIERAGEARRTYQAVLQATPHDASAHLGLAMVEAARRDYRTAEVHLREACRLDPGRPAGYLQLADVYARTGRAGEAARAGAMALRLGAAPDQVQLAVNRRLDA